MQKITVNRPDPQAMTQLLTYFHDTLPGVVIRLAWYLGLAAKEIQVLTWDMVDWNAKAVNLPDRSIPIPDDLLPYLEALYNDRGAPAGYVTLTDHGSKHPTRPHVSRVTREALDQYGQNNVRLLDLRHDYIIRQLDQHDWQYVSRVAGIELATLKQHYEHSDTDEKISTVVRKDSYKPKTIDEEKLNAIMEAEDTSPAGVSIRLAWFLGLTQDEMVSLTWDDIDFKRPVVQLPTRTISIPRSMAKFLQDLHDTNSSACNHVIMTERSQNAINRSFLTKKVRAALIQGGIDNVQLRDLRSGPLSDSHIDGVIFEWLANHKSITSAKVQEHTSASPREVLSRFNLLISRGRLLQIGRYYYLPGTVIPPEQHKGCIIQYLSQHGSMQKGDVAKELRIEYTQCLWILQKYMDEGWLRRENGKYMLNCNVKTD